MFLLNFFYGKTQQPCEQGTNRQEEDWVLVDSNDPITLSTSIEEDYGLLEKDDLLTSIHPDELHESQQPTINQLEIDTAHSEEEEGREREPLVQNQATRQQRVAVLKSPRAVATLTPPVPVKPTDLAGTGQLTNKVKNNCKKQSQRRTDKYKSGVWSGRSNDRKCGKCY